MDTFHWAQLQLKPSPAQDLAVKGECQKRLGSFPTKGSYVEWGSGT